MSETAIASVIRKCTRCQPKKRIITFHRTVFWAKPCQVHGDILRGRRWCNFHHRYHKLEKFATVKGFPTNVCLLAKKIKRALR